MKHVCLTHADETALILSYQRDGSLPARDRIVAEKMGLVKRMVALLVASSDHRFDDCVQEGAMGVMHALDMFDVTRGLRFSTYAGYWVRAKIVYYLRGQTRHTRSRVIVAGVLTPDMPTAAVVSMSEPIGDGEMSIEDLIADGSVPSPEAVVTEKQRRLELHERIADAKDRVGRGRNGWVETILSLRMLADEPAKLADVGAVLGVSREYARLFEQKMMRAMGINRHATINQASNHPVAA